MNSNLFFKMSAVLLSGVALLSSCQPKEYNITSTDTKINLSDEQQTKKVIVNGSDGNCEIRYYPDWIEPSMTDSTITINVTANTGVQNRSDSIVVTCGASHLTFFVTQVHKATRLEVKGKHKVTFTKEGGAQDVELDTDGLVKVEAFEGVSAVCENGKVTITAQPNKGVNPVDGIVKLTAGDLSGEIAVHINGAVCPTCNGTGKIKCRSCGGEAKF